MVNLAGVFLARFSPKWAETLREESISVIFENPQEESTWRGAAELKTFCNTKRQVPEMEAEAESNVTR